MKMKLTIEGLNFDECKSIHKIIEKQCKNNSLITIDVDYRELESLIKQYIKNNIDIDMDILNYNLNVDIKKNNIYIKVDYPAEDKNEYVLFTKELKHLLGNQIINNKSEINSKIMLRTMFIEALRFNISDSNLKITYDIDNLNELENIKLQI